MANIGQFLLPTGCSSPGASTSSWRPSKRSQNGSRSGPRPPSHAPLYPTNAWHPGLDPSDPGYKRYPEAPSLQGSPLLHSSKPPSHWDSQRRGSPMMSTAGSSEFPSTSGKMQDSSSSSKASGLLPLFTQVELMEMPTEMLIREMELTDDMLAQNARRQDLIVKRRLRAAKVRLQSVKTMELAPEHRPKERVVPPPRWPDLGPSSALPTLGLSSSMPQLRAAKQEKASASTEDPRPSSASSQYEPEELLLWMRSLHEPGRAWSTMQRVLAPLPAPQESVAATPPRTPGSRGERRRKGATPSTMADLFDKGASPRESSLGTVNEFDDEEELDEIKAAAQAAMEAALFGSDDEDEVLKLNAQAAMEAALFGSDDDDELLKLNAQAAMEAALFDSGDELDELKRDAQAAMEAALFDSDEEDEDEQIKQDAQAAMEAALFDSDEELDELKRDARAAMEEALWTPEDRKKERVAGIRAKAKKALLASASDGCLKISLQMVKQKEATSTRQNHLKMMRIKRERMLTDKYPDAKLACEQQDEGQEMSLEIDRARCLSAWKRMSSGGEMPSNELMNLLKMAGQKRGEQSWVDDLMRENFHGRSTLDEEDFWEFIGLYEKKFVEFLNTEFKRADADDSGLLSAGEMTSLLRRLGFTPTPWTVEELVLEITGVENSTQGLSMQQFMKLNNLLLKRTGFTRSELMQLKSLFLRYDRSGDGEIDTSELDAILAWSGYANQAEKTAELVAEVDRDQSGTIDEIEFLTIMRHHRELEIANLHKAFAEADTDHGGTVNLLELPRIFDDLGYMAAAPGTIREGIRKCGLMPSTPGEYLFEDIYILLDWFRAHEGFSDDEIQDLRESFMKYDITGEETVGDDRIGGMDLGNSIRWMGYPQSVEQLMDAIEEFDIDDVGTVSFPEFMKIMRGYREVEVKRVRDKFLERDADGSGSLNMAELKQVLLHLNFAPTMKELKSLFKELCHTDTGDTEEVGVWELQQLCNRYRLEARGRFRKNSGFVDKEVERYQHQFNKHDPQKDGFIDNKDLRKMLVFLFPGADHDPQAHAKVKKVIKMVEGDGKGDGKLDFDEYLKMMRVLQDEIEMAKYTREKDAIKDTNFSRKEVSEFRAIFQSFDADNSGKMTFEEFVVLVSQLLPERVVKGAKMTEDLKALLEDIQGETEDGQVPSLDFPGFLLIMRRIQDVNFGGINDIVNHG